MRVLWSFLALMALFVTIACSDRNINSSGTMSDLWLITGQIGDENFFAKEILILGMDGLRYRSAIQSDSTFAIHVPGNSSYAFYVIPDPQKTDHVAAILTYNNGKNMGTSDTLRLPKPT